MKEQLEILTKYNVWANSKIFDMVKSSGLDNFDREVKSSFPSIKATMLHTWDAENLWYQRLNGNSPKDWPSKNFKGNFEEFRLEFLQQSGKYFVFVNKLNDKDLTKDFTYLNIEGKEYTNSVYNTIVHVMNHSTYHRGQVITMLRSFGATDLYSTDYITYIREVPQK